MLRFRVQRFKGVKGLGGALWVAAEGFSLCYHHGRTRLFSMHILYIHIN